MMPMDETNLLHLALYVSTLGLIVWGIWQAIKLWYERGAAELVVWQNQAGPVVLGMIVVYSFYPYTIFTWLPFAPAVIVLPQLYSGILVASTSHLDHESFRHLGGFLMGVIERFSGYSRASSKTEAKG